MRSRIRLLSSVFAAAIALYAQDLNEDLLAAVRKSNVAAVRELLGKGADVNAKTSYGQTPLFFAADRGNVEIIQLLLDKGADVNAKDTFYKSTALSWAAMKGNVEAVRLLLAKGAQDVSGVLMAGVERGKPELVKAALETGKLTAADLSNGLSAAERQKKPEIAAILKEAGAKPRPEAKAQVAPEILATYAGKYVGGRGGTEMEIEVRAEGGKLSVSFGSNSLTLAAIDNTHFRGVEFDGMEVEFASGGLTLVQGGNRNEFKRAGTK